ncbi:MAG TPA: dockerin type I domain-containing protein [Tepidisphaeraceae bacterium]|nr:dockerin type I domain-containing protein [Tepidisphaeraceae bacterium]
MEESWLAPKQTTSDVAIWVVRPLGPVGSSGYLFGPQNIAGNWAGGPSTTNTLQIYLTEQDQLQFTVGNGPDGLAWDTTGLDVHITYEGNNPVLVTSPTAISAVEGASLIDQVVATFTNNSPDASWVGYGRPTVDWGDGSQSYGSVVLDSITGRYDVLASKPAGYSTTGPQRITVSINDFEGNSGSIVSTVQVTQPAQSHQMIATWDLAKDFSATQNPNGPWLYGTTSYGGAGGGALGEIFMPGPATASQSPGAGGDYDFYGGLQYFPTGYNSPDIIIANGLIIPAGAISLQPPNTAGTAPAASWTAPADGNYYINATFQAYDGATTDVHIFERPHNSPSGYSLWDGAINGFGSIQNYAPGSPIHLQAGDSLDFAVGYGSNGNNASDNTGLSVTIGQAPAVQETRPAYDLGTDWSESENPDGAWMLSAGDAALNYQSNWQGTSQSGWTEPGDVNGTGPFLFKDAGLQLPDAQPGDIVVQTVVSNQASGDAPATISWTSPADGFISISGSLWMAKDTGNSDHWDLLHNTSIVSEGALATGEYTRDAQFELSAGSGGPGSLQNIQVHAGDTITLRLISTSGTADDLGVNLRIGVTNGSAPSYTLGNIPTHFYAQGEPVSFYVVPPSGDSAPLSMQVSSPPQGDATFDPASGLFTYTPAAADKYDFNVTFQSASAIAGAEPNAQLTTISPVTLAPEYDVLETGVPASPPADTNSDYVTKTVHDDGTNFFNIRSQDTSDVAISGVTITLAPGATFGTGLPLDWDDTTAGVTNIQNLTIYAQKVIVSGHFRLPRTNVTIYAQQLDFQDPATGDAASLDTAAVPFSNSDPAPLGQNGANGEAAGNITLHIQTVDVNGNAWINAPSGQTTVPRFILNGGAGQGAATGAPPSATQTGPGPGQDGPVTLTVSGSAVNAPGNGGPAGHLASYDGIDVSPLTVADGGDPGAKSQYSDPTWGAGYPARGPTGASGAPDLPEVIPQAQSPINDWLTPQALAALVQYSKDVYLAGEIETAGQQFSQYQQWLDVLPPSSAQQFATLRPEINQYASQAAMNLDYFGKPAGWVPALSFAANYDAYKNEVENDLSVEFLSHIILDTNTSQQNMQLAMTNSIAQLGTDINLARGQYAGAENQVAPLNASLAKVQADTASVQSQLSAELSYLQAEATKNVADQHKLPFWKEALGVLSTVATALTPVNPVFGAVGAGLGLLSAGSSQASDNTQLAGIATAVKSSNLATAAQDLGKVINDPSKNTAQIIAVMSDYETAMIDISQASQQTQAPMSEVDAELKSLESQDPSFTSLVAQIQNLNAEKAQFQKTLAEAMQSIASASDRIVSDYSTEDALQRQQADSAAALTQDTVRQIKEMQRQASDRLLAYQYYMDKAYEYQTLTSFPLNWDLNHLSTDIYNLLSGPTPKGPSDFSSTAVIQALETPYENSLQQIGSQLGSVLNDAHPEQSHPQNFHLTPDQLAQLNSQGQVTMNLVDSGLIPATANATILEMGISQMSAAPLGNPSTADVTVEFDHSGTSLMEWQGHRYLFRNNLAADPISWSTDFDAIQGYQGQKPNAVDPTSVANAATFMGLNVGSLSNDPSLTEMLYSEPGAWGDVTIKLLVNNQPLSPTSVRVNISNATFYATWVAGRSQDSDSLVSVQPTGALTPKILVTDPTTGTPLVDDSGRSDGVGSFTRAFSSFGQKVALTAQPAYGSLAFTGWQDVSGNLLSTSTTYTVPMDGGAQIVRPAYSDLTPQGVTAAANANGGIDLSWTASQGAASYNVYRSTTPGGEYSPAFVSGVAGTSFIDQKATPGATYYYIVTAVSNGVESLYSSEVSAAPTAAVTLLSTAFGDGITTNTTQRSEVRTMTLKFDQPFALAASDLSLFMLNTGGSGLNDGSAPTPMDGSVIGSMTSPDGGLTWVVSFAKNTAYTDASGSLNDGIYTLTMNGAGIVPVAGGSLSTTFHRLFGDFNGDGTVNLTDYRAFKAAFLSQTGGSTYNPAFDSNGDGTINLIDYRRFKANFLKTLIGG